MPQNEKSYKEDTSLAHLANLLEVIFKVDYKMSQQDIDRFESLIQLAYNSGRVLGMEQILAVGKQS